MKILAKIGLAAIATGMLAAPAFAQDEATEAQAGKIPPPTIDTNDDGTPDAWDRDGDGNADVWDTDGDGKPDKVDDNGDGKPD